MPASTFPALPPALAMRPRLTVAAINGIFARVAARYAAERRAAEIEHGQAADQSATSPEAVELRRARCQERHAWARVEWAKSVEAAS